MLLFCDQLLHIVRFSITFLEPIWLAVDTELRTFSDLPLLRRISVEVLRSRNDISVFAPVVLFDDVWFKQRVVRVGKSEDFFVPNNLAGAEVLIMTGIAEALANTSSHYAFRIVNKSVRSISVADKLFVEVNAIVLAFLYWARKDVPRLGDDLTIFVSAS